MAAKSNGIAKDKDKEWEWEWDKGQAKTSAPWCQAKRFIAQWNVPRCKDQMMEIAKRTQRAIIKNNLVRTWQEYRGGRW